LRREGLQMAASSFRFPVLLRRFGRVLAASLILTTCFVVLTAGPVLACDVLDPTCVVETVDETVEGATETVEDTVEETSGEAEETVEETSGEAEETVEETSGEAEETVEETVETVEENAESVTRDAGETVDETVAAGIGSVDDAIGGPSQPTPPGTGPVPPGVDPAPSGGDGAGNGSDGNGSGGDDGTSGTPPGGVAGPFVLDPSALGSGLVNETVPVPRGFLGGLAGPAAEIASRIAFPLALAVLVMLFVAFQNRLDRRDPKLALAATSPDVLRFA
jgi:gas vesicle protein